MESWISDLGLQKSIAEARLALVPQYSLAVALETNKPYFGRQLSAFQSSPVRYALMAALTRYALRNQQGTVRVLEIGSWAGASTITMGAIILELGIADSQIVCIDPWEPYFSETDSSIHYQCMNAAAASGAIEHLFDHNIKACGLNHMVCAEKACSREALPGLQDGAFDLIYIDGSHKKDDVLYDLEQAKRLVRPGGIICGDDLELLKSQVDPQAHAAALVHDIDFVADPLSKTGYHPGVTEAIATMFDNVRMEQGFWCVEYSDTRWGAPTFSMPPLEIPKHLAHAVEIPYGTVGDYELFQLGDGFVAYPISDIHWFQHRILLSSIEELLFLLDAIERQNRTPKIVKTYRGFNILKYQKKVWALDRAVGEVDFRNEKTLMEIAASGHLFEADSISAACSAVDKRSQGGHVTRTKIGRTESRDGSSVAKKGSSSRTSAIAFKLAGEPHAMQERYQGFSLFIYAGQFWAVETAAGSVDVSNAEAWERLYAEGRLLNAATIDGVRAAIDRLLDRRVFKELLKHFDITQTKFDAAQDTLHERLASIQQAMDRIEDHNLSDSATE